MLRAAFATGAVWPGRDGGHGAIASTLAGQFVSTQDVGFLRIRRLDRQQLSVCVLAGAEASATQCVVRAGRCLPDR